MAADLVTRTTRTSRPDQVLPSRWRRRSSLRKPAAAGLAGLAAFSGGATIFALAAPGAGAAVTTAAVPAVPGVGAPFDCTGSTLYTVSFGSTEVINAVDPGSGQETQITTVNPTLGEPNALGLGADGLNAFYVDDTDADKVYDYNAITKQTTSFATSTPNTSKVVSGAIDPTNGFYYYAEYAGNEATVFAFDTATDTPATGAVATIQLGIPSTGTDFFGDITFDSAGNMFLLDGSTPAGSPTGAGALEEVPGPIPTTGSATPPPIQPTLSNSTLVPPSGQEFNGIAFNSQNHLFIQAGPPAVPGATSTLFQLDPTTGAEINGPAGVTIGLPDTDLASCFSSITVQKNIVQRLIPTDEFTLSVTDPSGKSSTVTTTGTSVGLQAAEAAPLATAVGEEFTVAETGAAGTSVADYAATHSCVNATTGAVVGVPGPGASFQFTVPPLAAGTFVNPPIVCTFTNAPLAELSLTKAFGGNRVNATDQFTVALRTGGATGPVVNLTAHSTTAGTGSEVTAGTGTTGTFVATPGTAYSLTEAETGSSTPGTYSAFMTCVDENGKQTGLPSKAAVSGSVTITPVAGADISCVLTNDPTAVVTTSTTLAPVVTTLAPAAPVTTPTPATTTAASQATLAATGAHVGPALAAAVLLLLTGAGAVSASRRRPLHRRRRQGR
jgi:hypothetical protein